MPQVNNYYILEISINIPRLTSKIRSSSPSNLSHPPNPQPPTPAKQNVGCQKKNIISVKLHLSQNPFPNALSVQTMYRSQGIRSSHHPHLPSFQSTPKDDENTGKKHRGVKVAQGQIWVTSFFLRIMGLG